GAEARVGRCGRQSAESTRVKSVEPVVLHSFKDAVIPNVVHAQHGVPAKTLLHFQVPFLIPWLPDFSIRGRDSRSYKEWIKEGGGGVCNISKGRSRRKCTVKRSVRSGGHVKHVARSSGSEVAGHNESIQHRRIR